MSDVGSGVGLSGAAGGVAGVVGGLGLALDPSVADGAGLASLAGPFLTTNIVDADGQVVACVAVSDGPTGGDETLLDRLASLAAVEVGGSVATGEPVADGAGITKRFTTPISVQVFGDGPVRVLSVSATDRRGAADAAGAGGIPATGVAAAEGRVTEGFGTGPSPVPSGSGAGLEKLINVSLDVSVELGRTRVTLADVLAYDVGSVVELDRAAGAPVDVRVNDTLLAQGEVVLIDDEYAVRITAIFDQNQPRH